MKVIEINNCKECPYHELHLSKYGLFGMSKGGIYLICANEIEGKQLVSFDSNKSALSYVIPNWCPLKEAKQ